MPQTFYIENDEEIISVIGRLRKSSSQENYFVFPKRSLVLQSIINMRLFQREAQKLGKKIVVVTQDEDGKRLAEKAGLETESYSDDFATKASHIEIVEPVSMAKKEAVATKDMNVPKSQDIGSMDFYTAPEVIAPKGNTIAPPAPQPVEGTSLRIRNATPQKLTTLNSMRPEAEGPALPKAPAPMFNPSISMPAEKPLPSSYAPLSASKPTPMTEASRDERLKNFFSPQQNTSQEKRPVSKGTSSPRVPVTSNKARHVFFILGSISLLSILGVGLFLFLPKAEVHVVPHKMARSIDQQYDGRTTGDMNGDTVIPVRIIEKEIPVTLAIQATGTSAGSAQKARGSVIISNAFNADPQPLVATTRFESTDGKIFRLIEGVTVPGMKNNEPGTVTAAVIADQTGSAYNIAATTFTIPGFKGSAKFDKFSAKSTKPMVGGGDATGSDITVISKADLDKAESEAKEKVKSEYLEGIKGELQSGDKVLEEVLEITPLNQSALPVAGTAASSFDYQNTYKVKTFVFSEKLVKEKIEEKTTEKIGDINFKPVSVVLSYGESLPNFNEGTLRLKAHASVIMESVIDQSQLSQELLGKDESGINDLLNDHPEVKKVQIQIKPQWFSSAIPKSKDRVSIIVEPGEE